MGLIHLFLITLILPIFCRIIPFTTMKQTDYNTYSKGGNMKKMLLIMSFAVLAHGIFAAETQPVAAPGAATLTAQTGINIDTAGIKVENGSMGINGLALRFLKADGSGFEVPMGFTYNYGYDNGQYFPYNLSGTLSSGYCVLGTAIEK
jgi:branched-subunit amino acid transport protein AzlD